MEFKKIIKACAIEFAKKNSIVMPGEIVETVWPGWKKPHQVKIYDIGSAISLNSWKNIKGDKRYCKDVCTPKFGMYYYAQRLKADGTPKDKKGCGIVLDNFKTKSGKKWEQTHELINHCAYHFSIVDGK